MNICKVKTCKELECIRWYKNNKRHRNIGPAFIGYYTKAWYKNNKYHRLDGPAREWGDGIKEWYINGKKYSEQEWFETLPELNQIGYLFNMR